MARCMKEPHKEHREADNEEEEPTELVVLETITYLASSYKIVEIEVDTGQEQEDDTDILDGGGMEMTHRVGVVGETSTGHGREGMTDGIEHRHTCHPIEHGIEHRQGEIDAPQTTGCLLNLGTKLIDLKAIGFGTENLGSTGTNHRQQCQREDHDTQTAQPLRETAPEKDGMRLLLQIVDGGTTGSGEARHRLHKGIGDIGARAIEQIGHHAEHREDHPGGRDHQETLSRRNLFRMMAVAPIAPGTQKPGKQTTSQEINPIALAQREMVIESHS